MTTDIAFTLGQIVFNENSPAQHSAMMVLDVGECVTVYQHNSKANCTFQTDELISADALGAQCRDILAEGGQGTEKLLGIVDALVAGINLAEMRDSKGMTAFVIPEGMPVSAAEPAVDDALPLNVAALLAYAIDRSSEDSALDELVHSTVEDGVGKDGAASSLAYYAASLSASDINNNGFAAQIKFLLDRGVCESRICACLDGD